MTNDYLLSVCIPTFQRRFQLERIINCFCKIDDWVEICVVVDGSTDSTISYLESISLPNIKYIVQGNRGRNAALRKAVELASAPFIMLFDDDDIPVIEAFPSIYDDLTENSFNNEQIAGFIYSMFDGDSPKILGGALSDSNSNFIQIRADQGVSFDRKEVVRSDLLKGVFKLYSFKSKRVPTSLYWFTIALDYTVKCRNLTVGRKYYLDNGITNNIIGVKLKNPEPMLALNRIKMKGFFMRRYSSFSYFFKSILGSLYYFLLSGIRRFIDYVYEVKQ